MKKYSDIIGFIFVVAMLAACAGERPLTLAEGSGSGSVSIRYDLQARPFPEVPLPNDSATRLDDRSPTGRFVNISKVAPTLVETETRILANNVSGFGIYMPITVPLDGMIDLENVIKRHCDEDVDNWASKTCDNRGFADDVAWLINLDDPSKEGFGELVPLDFGQGNFPLTLELKDNYFENDYRVDGWNLVFETYDEDVNGNGVLDPGEDTNGDGLLGVPNVLPGMAERLEEDPSFVRTVDDLIPFFELATNTLVFRPVLPLRQNTRYAVVISKHLKGADGEFVKSPFPGTHPANQWEAMQDLPAALEKNGLSLDDVAFSWVYTTQDVTGQLEVIREGLYGSGVMSRLAQEFSVDDMTLNVLRDDGKGKPYIMPLSILDTVLGVLGSSLLNTTEAGTELFVSDLKYVDFVVMGSIPGPDFLVDRDGNAEENYPSTDDEAFEVDVQTGEAVYGRTDVTYWCFVPKASEGFEPPFDVAMYGHGYTTSRLETLGFAGRMARFGIATCSLDAYGHGSPDNALDDPLGEDIQDIVRVLLKDECELKDLEDAVMLVLSGTRDCWNADPWYEGPAYTNFVTSLLTGRARDLNNDGVPDSGGDFWTYDIFHTRDIVRQTVVDIIQFYRQMRSFDGTRVWTMDTDSDGRPNLAGDFNGDGIVDIGGPDSKYLIFGGSMGGILSGILPGIEPALDASMPVAGGAGLFDIGVRSRQGGVPEAVYMPLLGPLVVGQPITEGSHETEISFVVNNVNKKDKVIFHVTDSIEPGDMLVLENLINGHTDSAIVGADLRFRLTVPCDALSATEKRGPLGLLPDNSNAPAVVTDPARLGDLIRLVVYQGYSGPEKFVIDTWNQEADWQGARYLAGTTLTAISKGLGKKRQTPDIRRFTALSAMVLEPGDPIGYGRHYALEPLDFSYDEKAVPGTGVLFAPSIGDMNVPISTGVAMARGGGVFGMDYETFYAVDEDYGMTPNDTLIRNWVLEGTEATKRFKLPAQAEGDKCDGNILYDADDLDNGTSDFQEPNLDKPLRQTISVGQRALGLRIPYVDCHGSHGFGIPTAESFDISGFMMNQAGWFMSTGGSELRDDACLENASCDFLPERVREDPLGNAAD